MPGVVVELKGDGWETPGRPEKARHVAYESSVQLSTAGAWQCHVRSLKAVCIHGLSWDCQMGLQSDYHGTAKLSTYYNGTRNCHGSSMSVPSQLNESAVTCDVRFHGTVTGQPQNRHAIGLSCHDFSCSAVKCHEVP